MSASLKLIDEIIDLASSNSTPVSVLLRKCLVLSFDLKNHALKAWANSELDGYDFSGAVPDYRKCQAGAKGNFLGPFQSSITGRPLPPMLLNENHRHFSGETKLVQPIASYEALFEEGGSSRAVIEWPSDLVLIYQNKLIQGYGLTNAWQEIPGSAISGLLDTVRNRVLRFALELREELGRVDDVTADLTPRTVERVVNTYIYGGTNVIAQDAHYFTQSGDVNVGVRDMDALVAELAKLGVQQSEIQSLKEALDADEKEAMAPSFGRRTAEWTKKAAEGVGGAALKMGSDVATQFILQYLGLGKP